MSQDACDTAYRVLQRIFMGERTWPIIKYIEECQRMIALTPFPSLAAMMTTAKATRNLAEQHASRAGLGYSPVQQGTKPDLLEVSSIHREDTPVVQEFAFPYQGWGEGCTTCADTGGRILEHRLVVTGLRSGPTSLSFVREYNVLLAIRHLALSQVNLLHQTGFMAELSKALRY